MATPTRFLEAELAVADGTTALVEAEGVDVGLALALALTVALEPALSWHNETP
jgi:hypothetical protein